MISLKKVTCEVSHPREGGDLGLDSRLRGNDGWKLYYKRSRLNIGMTRAA